MKVGFSFELGSQPIKKMVKKEIALLDHYSNAQCPSPPTRLGQNLKFVRKNSDAPLTLEIFEQRASLKEY